MQEDIEKLVRMFKALADPTRLQILMILEKRPLSVNEIVDYFQLSQPTISRHLLNLAQAGLIIGEKREQRKIYSLDSENLNYLIKGLSSGFKAANSSK